MTLGPDLMLDEITHDIDVSGGDLKMQTDLVQAVRIKLKFVLGDWFLDTERGIPYFERILGQKNPDRGQVAGYFRKAILEVPGINSITQLDVAFNAATRAMTVTFRADSDEGEISGVETI